MIIIIIINNLKQSEPKSKQIILKYIIVNYLSTNIVNIIET